MMSKYQLIERERKFLLASDQVDTSSLLYKQITDHYLNGTMLRFRMVADDTGEQYKLTQKTSLTTPGESTITTIYLDKQAFAMLNIFDAVTVSKTRYLLQLSQLVVGLDHYRTGTGELWLAEVEFPSREAMRDFDLPLPYVREVTGLPEYDGYALAKRFQQRY
jgi:CYTH domain-containing protein